MLAVDVEGIGLASPDAQRPCRLITSTVDLRSLLPPLGSPRHGRSNSADDRLAADPGRRLASCVADVSTHALVGNGQRRSASCGIGIRAVSALPRSRDPMACNPPLGHLAVASGRLCGGGLSPVRQASERGNNLLNDGTLTLPLGGDFRLPALDRSGLKTAFLAR